MAKRRKVEVPEWVDDIRHQDDNGHEIVDPKPVAIPAGFQRPETLAEQVRRLVRTSKMSDDDVLDETWEDAIDFDIGDDFDPKTPWETVYDEKLGREVTPEEFQRNWPDIRKELQTKLRNHYRLLAQAEREEEMIRNAGTPRGAGVSPAPSSEAAKPPPAEQK